MYRDLNHFTETLDFIINYKMVAERSVYFKLYSDILSNKIRSENVGMSSDKQCEKHCRLKS
jgi:hypothetical protein